MVTFAFPGDDASEANTRTPKSRPLLPFAKRGLSGSPFIGGSAKRLGTPRAASSATTGSLLPREEALNGTLSRSSLGVARNIFRASAISNSPPAASTFSPSIPQNTPRRIFAPGATPDASRKFRDATVQATPQGLAAKTTNQDLFQVRISSPPPELSGETLTRKVPKEWSSTSSIYADQYLAHLCPPEFDDEQRRQFFCILDLRRLKYAADEIFSKKNWKLNVMNFAKEFEKSRSIILLRYGLYKFQNVQPSKDVLKRWRREHGLAEPEEEASTTPSRPSSSKKRKAVDDGAKEALLSNSSGKGVKRRTVEGDEEQKESTDTPAKSNFKRKSLGDEDGSGMQPNKMQKPTPSAAKTLFEKAVSKTSSVDAFSQPQPSPLAKAQPTSAGPPRSVFSNLGAGVAQSQTASKNIFGHISDNSAQNSGVDADSESESGSVPRSMEKPDSEAGGSLSQDGPKSTAQTSATPNMFGKVSAVGGHEKSDASSSRSLFERVSRGNDIESTVEKVSSGIPEETPGTDKTWNPSTTPIKFAPTQTASQGSSVFGKAPPATGTSLFAPKPSAESAQPSANMFGAAKLDQTVNALSAPVEEAHQDLRQSTDDAESDKENDAKSSAKLFAQVKETTSQSPFGNALFQPKPSSTQQAKEAEPTKPMTSLFGAPPKQNDSSVASAPSIFGSAAKPDETVKTQAPIMQSSTLFGSKPVEPVKSAMNQVNGAGLFGLKKASDTDGASKSRSATPPTSLFAKPSPALASAADTAAQAQTANTPAPIFNFGGSTTPKPPANTASVFGSKPLFGAPKSPGLGSSAPLFSGSPMKQDEPSPAKRPFSGASAGNSTPSFSFGGTPSSQPTTLFGAAPIGNTNNPNNQSFNLGAATQNSASGSFDFNFGAPKASDNSAANPFASAPTTGNTGASKPSGGGLFSFGGSSATTSGTSSPFQFGNTNGNGAPPAAIVSNGINGASSANQPMFGGTQAAPSGGSIFNFSSSQPTQGPGTVFGSNPNPPAFGNLQPPTGGTSTTGTNTPFTLGGGSSLATTPARGTPEPGTQANGEGAAEEDGAEKQEQVNLTEGAEAEEDIVHEVRAKVLRFIPASEREDGEDKAKSKSPWSTQGVGPLRLLKHKETKTVRLLLRAEPRGHVALNRAVLPDMTYKADEKYVKMTTSNEKGDGLETWMIQVKTKDLAKALAEELEKNKIFNKKQE